MNNPQKSPDDLQTKVQAWLDQEGYPLEFAAAAVFRRHGFQVRQGTYVRVDDEEKAREIDVVAYKDAGGDALIRIYHVVECKWSKDKPWVVFTGSGSMASAACITQTISSLLGSAIVWTQAGLEQLHGMNLFTTPRRAGFNGRQAFSKGNDEFYNAMSSVSSLSTLLVENYDDEKRARGILPKSAVLAFPVIVVDGRLFEAYFDSAENKLKLEESQCLRCHWRGAPAWRLHATIDIVTFDYLRQVCGETKGRGPTVTGDCRDNQASDRDVFCTGLSLDTLPITEGPRGVVGLHRLLREVLEVRKHLQDSSEKGS
jgi:hypothetical protein